MRRVVERLPTLQSARTFCRRLHNIVLISPDIPGNTGSIGRTAMATGCRLHLVHPLGFSTDEKSFRRAGLDYWSRLDVREHENWDAFVDAEFGPGIAGQTRPSAWLFTTKASMRPHWEGAYQDGDYLLFGSETRGAPDHVHEWVSQRFGEHCRVCLPMRPEARSLNLAVSVGVAVYEAQRQLAARVNA